MRGPGTWWRGKSTPAKVETYTRWSFHFFAVMEFAAVPLLGFSGIGPRLAIGLQMMVGLHAVTCAVTASRALDWARGRRERPVRQLWTLGGVTAMVSLLTLAIVEHGPSGDDVDSAAGGAFGTVLIFGVCALALGVRQRRQVVALVGGFGLGAAVVSLALGRPWPAALFGALAVLLGAGLLAFTAVISVWLLNTVYELDEARETRARLAVAEERLRFGRDLHDVMGRNLTVIALKSELAVQLAQRGRAEAVEQMIEVQRIAHATQREVRDVVRGYREADLEVELVGAQGVLTAAGIRCELTGEATGLPTEVQSALGWVVREATTNVLRHGDAGRCAVSLRVTEGRVVLMVENDGVGASSGRDSGTDGSGLAGLRERLAAVDGTLEAGPVDGGLFRLVAEVPLSTASMREVMA
ncbi:histidine kinase [Streptomyces sp. NPDC002838]|uniref:sensor histidine kinase n=1 Tax=Streptomyces sp. NPDC002838 TaxID=3154436 RepID=UPI003319FD43